MEQKKIKKDELINFSVLPYQGDENDAPAHPDIISFVNLALSKGYSKEDLLVAWGECQGIKKELQEEGKEDNFEGERFQEKFDGEMTLLRAICYLFRHLNTAGMDLYYISWLKILRNS